VLVIYAKSCRGDHVATEVRLEGAARESSAPWSGTSTSATSSCSATSTTPRTDRSLNMLEIGDPEAPVPAEDEPGAFLVNLAEPFYSAETREPRADQRRRLW
jgi:hypothetical protein